MSLCFATVFFSAGASAQTGRGGSTEVIARIETSAADESEELPPSQSQPVTSASGASSSAQNGDPVKTGDLFLFIPIAAGAAIAILFAFKFRKDS